MPQEFSKEQKSEIAGSLKRYFSENFDHELSDIEAGFFLEYVMSEIAPFAYNQGVEDARRFIAAAAEDLSGTCFQETLAYWKKSGARMVRRKP